MGSFGIIPYVPPKVLYGIPGVSPCGVHISPSSYTIGFEIKTELGRISIEQGHAIRGAIGAGLRVDALVLSEEPYLDIGTPEDLMLAIKNNSAGKVPRSELGRDYEAAL